MVLLYNNMRRCKKEQRRFLYGMEKASGSFHLTNG